MTRRTLKSITWVSESFREDIESKSLTAGSPKPVG